MSAIDLATPITSAMIPAMKAAGIEAVCRYLSNNAAKNLSIIEARLLSDAGINIVLVWEAAGDRYDSFTETQGIIDAQRAVAQAKTLGAPPRAAIYFAVDFDATDAQIGQGITGYMKRVAGIMSPSGYRLGVYGNGAVCKAMLDTGIADLAWVWGAGGTNGTAAFVASGRWAIRQHPTIREFGVSVDPDDVQGDYGGWRLPSAGQVYPADIVPDAMTLQGALKAAGLYQGAIDGVWGNQSQAALAAYYRRSA